MDHAIDWSSSPKNENLAILYANKKATVTCNIFNVGRIPLACDRLNFWNEFWGGFLGLFSFLWNRLGGLLDVLVWWYGGSNFWRVYFFSSYSFAPKYQFRFFL